MLGGSTGSRSAPVSRAKVHQSGCRRAAREAALAAAVAATVVACGHGRIFAWSVPRRHPRSPAGGNGHRVSPGGVWTSPLALTRSRVASRSGGTGTAVSIAKKPSARVTSRIKDGWLAPVFLLCAGGNKILLRLLVVPMREYTYFLSVLINLAYLTFFGARIARPGKEAAAAKLRASVQFALRGVGLQCLAGAGVCEAFSIVLMPLFAARLPGSLLPVMQQGLLLFSMLSSALLLGRRYDMLQVCGVATVAIGVVVCTRLDFLGGPALAAAEVAGPQLLDALGFLAAYVFIALALTLKELAFERFAEQKKATKGEGEALNADVVNFFTAAWQGLALLLFWPLNFRLLTSLTVPAYFHGAAAASLSWAGLLGLVVAVNLAYTAVTTVVLQRLSAVVLLLTNVLNVPLVSLFFCLNIPMLGAERFRWSFLAGLCIIILGLLIYNHRSWRATK